MEDLSDLDARVILSTGGHDIELPHPPSNFVIRPWIPEQQVFDRASAFVGHGGIGSLSKAFHAGVPAVIIPQIREQALVAWRAAELGAAIHLPQHRLRPGRLREAVMRIFENDSFRTSATALGRSFDQTPGMSGAADAVIDYVTTAGR